MPHASSTDTSPDQRIASVGQTFSNVSAVFINTSAGISHRMEIHAARFDSLLIDTYDNAQPLETTGHGLFARANRVENDRAATGRPRRARRELDLTHRIRGVRHPRLRKRWG